MNKINNKIIVLSLSALTILNFSLIFVPLKEISAQNTSWYYPYHSYNPYDYSTQSNYGNYATSWHYSSAYPNYYQTQAYTYTPAPIYYSPAPTPAPIPTPTSTIYSSTANLNPVKAVPKTTVAVAKTKTVSPANTSSAETNTSANSNLVANALWGSGGFLPSSLFQWILFAVLIMLAVILVRKIYGGAEKYHAIPMKHD